MKPWHEIGRSAVPGGGEMVLSQRDDEFVIQVDGLELMTNRVHGSEESLASICCTGLSGRRAPTVLIGGLGMGYTLRATLDLLPANASVLVAELVPAVVEWNRGPLAALAGRPLDDRRVTVKVQDVLALVRRTTARFDAILLDVDNGPDDIIFERNRGLYVGGGLVVLHQALRADGVLGIWSVTRQDDAEDQLRRASFIASQHRVPARASGRGGSRFIYRGIRGA